MGHVEIRVELPEDVATLLGPTDEAASLEARRAIVLELLRQGKLSQGAAARVLRLTRHDIVDLMAEHDVPSGPSTATEALQDIENALAATHPAGSPRAEP